jgi:transcriptional regulator with XRE-family HTH domain
MNIDPYSNPVAFFAAEMKRMRAERGLTQEQLADAAMFAPSTVAAVETCRFLPSEQFAEAIDEPLNGAGHFVRLQKLVERTSMPPFFRERVEVERKARMIQEYESYQVPALLQTESYMRTAALARRPMFTEDALDRIVALRMTRQQVLELDDTQIERENPLHRLWAVVDESALRRRIGSPEVMREQYQHLLAKAQQANITIQIIPESKGATCAYGRTFTILTPESNSPIVYLEDFRSAHYVRERDEVAQYVLAFDHLRASALDDHASMDLVKEYLNDLA